MAAKTPTKKRPKTVSRFAALSGANYSPDSDVSDDAEVSDAGGVVGGLVAAEIQASGHRIRNVSVWAIARHPFNNPKRSEPAPGDPKWDELVRSIKARGVQVPGLAVTRAAFVAARPSTQIPEDVTHVLIYGHRRLAASIFGGLETMPLVVDDSVLRSDGDLDAMAVENLGRQDLDALAEAQMYARYSEDVGLSQAAIAERLGVDQATVSRRLALLLLSGEVLAALDQERLSAAAAAALAGALPYGPPRRWQKVKSADQESEDRRADQTAALRLMIERNTSPTRAAERVLAERKARREAERRGVRVVDDPRSVVGADYLDRQVDDPAPGVDVVAAIDDSTGTLVFFSTAPVVPEPAVPVGGSTPTGEGGRRAVVVVDPADVEGSEVGAESRGQGSGEADVVAGDGSSGGPDGRGEVSGDREESSGIHGEAGVSAEESAREARLTAVAEAAASVPGKTRLAELLVGAVAAGVDFQARTVVEQADAWAVGTSGGGGDSSFKAEAAVAWRRLLAGYEALVGAIGWGSVGRAYVDVLHERVGYVPSAWERRQIGG